MNVGVVGSRTIAAYKPVERAIIKSPWMAADSWGFHDTIISGGADGVDSSAEAFAERMDCEIQVIEPDYSDWSGSEHPAKRRNTRIVEESDAIIAVWDGQSNGTRDTIDKALDRSVPIYVEVVHDG